MPSRQSCMQGAKQHWRLFGEILFVLSVTLCRFFFGEDVKDVVAREQGERRNGGVIVVRLLSFLLEGGFWNVMILFCAKLQHAKDRASPSVTRMTLISSLLPASWLQCFRYPHASLKVPSQDLVVVEQVSCRRLQQGEADATHFVLFCPRASMRLDLMIILAHITALLLTSLCRCLATIAEGIDFDTVAREWRCKWSVQEEKASLVAAQKAFESYLSQLQDGRVYVVLVYGMFIARRLSRWRWRNENAVLFISFLVCVVMWRNTRTSLCLRR